MYNYMNGQIIQPEEAKIVVDRYYGKVYAMFNDGNCAPLVDSNGYIYVNPSAFNSISIAAISNR